MKVDMSCGGQKKPLHQDSQYGYEELTKVGGESHTPHHGGQEEVVLLPGASVVQVEGTTCPQCRRLLRVVYVIIGLVILCLGLIVGMGLVQYTQYKDTLAFGHRLEAFCPGAAGTGGGADQAPASTAPPGGQVGQVGKPPRGAGVPGGPWDLVPPTAPDYGEEEDLEEEEEEEEEHRGRRSATGESGGRAASGERRARHRHKRCISCPTNMTTVEHLEGHPNSIQKPGNSSGSVTSDYGGADPRIKGDMFRNWKLADWSTGVKNSFNATTGLLTIEDPGLYWVYGQVMFYNSVFDNGFAVKIYRYSETAHMEEGENLAMCMHTTDYNDPKTPQYNDKYRTCNVGLPTLLNKWDRIGIASLYEGRMVVFSKPSSFWGIIKQSPPPP